MYCDPLSIFYCRISWKQPENLRLKVPRPRVEVPEAVVHPLVVVPMAAVFEALDGKKEVL